LFVDLWFILTETENSHNPTREQENGLWIKENTR
jgi:hypothetical protein